MGLENMNELKVLIVEDDPMVMDIHKRFTLSIPGFSVIGLASNGKEALKVLDQREVDLIILDIFMPELDGIDMLHLIRRNRRNVDTIVISAAHEMEILKRVMRFGAFDFIVKPFTYERFKQALQSYREFYYNEAKEMDQNSIDRIMGHRSDMKGSGKLPKGLSPRQLDNIIAIIENSPAKLLSAEEVAKEAGISRVTARRYLEYLVSIDRAVLEPLYHNVGRPLNRYGLLKTDKREKS